MEALRDEYDIVRLDADGTVNVAGVVQPAPESLGEALSLIAEMKAECPGDRLAVRVRKVSDWKFCG